MRQVETLVLVRECEILSQSIAYDFLYHGNSANDFVERACTSSLKGTSYLRRAGSTLRGVKVQLLRLVYDFLRRTRARPVMRLPMSRLMAEGSGTADRRRALTALSSRKLL